MAVDQFRKQPGVITPEMKEKILARVMEPKQVVETERYGKSGVTESGLPANRDWLPEWCPD